MLGAATKPASAVDRNLSIPRARLYTWTEDAEKKRDQLFQAADRSKTRTDSLSDAARECATQEAEFRIRRRATPYFATDLP